MFVNYTCTSFIDLTYGHFDKKTRSTFIQMHPLLLTFGAFAATFAASAYCILLNKVLNFLTNSSSAPARLFLTARRRAKSGFWRTLVMYGIMLSSSTLTDNTYKDKVLSLENLQHRKLQTLHVQPFLEGIFTQIFFPKYLNSHSERWNLVRWF